MPRVVTKAGKAEHIMPILRELHWLPVDKRIQHKLLSVAFHSVKENTALCLSDLLQMYTPSRCLRSESKCLLGVSGPRDAKTRLDSLQVRHTLSMECPAREHQANLKTHFPMTKRSNCACVLVCERVPIGVCAYICVYLCAVYLIFLCANINFAWRN